MFDFLTGSMLILISMTPVLFKLLIKGDYELAYNQMSLLYIGVFLSSISSFFGSIYIARKATRAVGVSSMIGAIANCIINITLIKWMGLYAASLSTIVSYLILVVYRGIDINNKGYAAINYDKNHLVKCILMIIVSALICYQRIFALNIINVIYGAIFFTLLNKKIINAFVVKIKKKIRLINTSYKIMS